MNRTAVRVFGVAVGAVLGLGTAILFRGPLSGRMPWSSTPRTVSTREDSDDEEDDNRMVANREANDPGSRKRLAELVAAIKDEPRWLKDFELTERSGNPFGTKDLKGQPYIVCFFYSTCKSTCKRQSDQMRLLQSKLRGQPIRLVSISVDPEVDTPEVLAEYAKSFEADPEKWFFLTGSMEQIERIGAEKYFLAGVEKRGHPDRFCLVNAEGNIVGSYVWLDLEEREQLIQHVNELLQSTEGNPPKASQSEDRGRAG